MKQKVVILSNLLEKPQIKKTFRFLDENILYSSKSSYMEVFENILALLLYESGLLSRRAISGRKIEQIASRNAPDPSYSLSEETIDEIVSEAIDLLVESSDTMDKYLSKMLSDYLSGINDENTVYDRFRLLYENPNEHSMMIVLEYG